MGGRLLQNPNAGVAGIMRETWQVGKSDARPSVLSAGWGKAWNLLLQDAVRGAMTR